MGFIKNNFIFIVIGIIALIFLGTLKRLFSSTGKLGEVLGKTEGQKKLKERVDQITSIKPDYNKTTIKKEQAAARADILYQAMSGPGTSEQKIFEVLEGLKNPEDLLAVYNEFGLRPETVFGFPVFEGDLLGWFESELSGEELKKAKEPFESAGIW